MEAANSLTTPAEPRVTVVVTCFNQERWIEQALDSVAAQTERDLQLIVTDDASTDGSRLTIERWLIRHDLVGELVAPASNVGLPAILNRAMPKFRGRYVVVLNGDDWMEPDRIARQADALDEAPPDVGLVYSELRVVDENGGPTGEIFPLPEVERPEGDVLHRMISDPMLGMPMVMFRRDVLGVIGPWDETLPADDYDFFLRLAIAGFEFVHLRQPLVNYRWYPESATGSRGQLLTEGRILALRKLLGRDTEIDQAIVTRIRELVVALHSSGYSRSATIRHAWFTLRRQPSPRIARVLVESCLHLRPGALALRSIRSVRP